MFRFVVISLIYAVPALCVESEMGSNTRPESSVLQGDQYQCTPEAMDTGNKLANKFCELSTKNTNESKQKRFEACIRKNIVEYGREDCLPKDENVDNLKALLCSDDNPNREETQKILCCYGNKVNRESKQNMANEMLKNCGKKYFF